jgi:hypothetical protein
MTDKGVTIHQFSGKKEDFRKWKRVFIGLITIKNLGKFLDNPTEPVVISELEYKREPKKEEVDKKVDKEAKLKP